MIHLVRNAVAHGVEDRYARQRAGKSEKGRISVRAYHRGNHIFIEVEDDGRGIDYESARRRVVEMGAMSPSRPTSSPNASCANFSSGPDSLRLLR